MYPKGPYLRYLVPLLTFLFISMMMPVTSAQFSARPTLTISPLDPQAIVVNITETDGGTAEYLATVTVTKPPAIGTVTVDLSAQCEGAFPTTVEPNQLVFTSPGDAAINITVIVPGGVLSNASYRVTVTGIAKYVGGSVSAMSVGALSVSQYYQLEGKVYTLVGDGSPQEFDISVRNLGNGPDSFTLTIIDRTKLENDGFEFVISKVMTEDLQNFENESLHLKITYKATTPSGDRTIKVRLTSEGSKEEGKLIYVDVTLNVKVKHIGTNTPEQLVGLVAIVFVLILVLGVALALSARSKAKAKEKKKARSRSDKKKDEVTDGERKDKVEEGASNGKGEVTKDKGKVNKGK